MSVIVTSTLEKLRGLRYAVAQQKLNWQTINHFTNALDREARWASEDMPHTSSLSVLADVITLLACQVALLKGNHTTPTSLLDKIDIAIGSIEALTPDFAAG